MVGDVEIQPLLHASMHITWDGNSILTDPYKNDAYYKALPSPQIILITDIHGDHLNLASLKNIKTDKSHIIAPKAVADILKENGYTNVDMLHNGDSIVIDGLKIAAIPMYNLPEDSESRHTKGRGNGYVLTLGEKRIYISGDTEDIPEMRQLKNIDIAFVCMNLPYTMDVNAAASAVLDFSPAIVFPFHYRGGGGKFSDVTKFKELVIDGNDQIDVRLVDWYQQ
jgi:L-ascorbate metabolism protein UlaG (beta-lactamase superfamily)